MNKIRGYITAVTTLLLLLVAVAFGQQVPDPDPVNVVDTGALINIALGVSGVISSVVLTWVRNKFNLSSLSVYVLYLSVSAAIAFGVTYTKGALDFSNLASSFAVIFTVGQAVYQSMIKGTLIGEIGNRSDPPSITNEDTGYREVVTRDY